MSARNRNPWVIVAFLTSMVALAACGGSSGDGGEGGGEEAPPSADLASLVPSAGTLSPAFDPGTLAYTVGPAGLLSVGSVTVTLTPADPNATVTVNGVAVAKGSRLPLATSPTILLPIGSTPVLIEVTATDTTTTRSYTVAFTRAGPTTQEAYVKASNTDADDRFGTILALSGDTLVVGAPEEASAATGVDGDAGDNMAPRSGAAYVFARSGTTWSQQAYLKASNTEFGDTFGDAVAVSGDTVLVSAAYEDSAATGVGGNEMDNGAEGSGAAYVFTRSGTTWSQQAYLKASNTESWDEFGSSVAIVGNTVVVGALGEDSDATGVDGNGSSNGASSSGAAYVFMRTGSTWTPRAYLKASNTGEDDRFGSSVALSGAALAVGAQGEASNATGLNGSQTDDSAAWSGAAYVFTRTGTAWSQQAYAKASNSEANDYYGGSVALWGDTLVVGAISEDSNATGLNGDQGNNAADISGAAYVVR